MSTDDLSRRRFLEASAAAAAVAVTVGVAVTVAAHAADTVPLAAHLVARLRANGVDRLFGVPGATCDPLFAAADTAGLPIVVASSDLEAGYAADGYARLRGLSAVAVTYGVGTMALLSVIAGAHAERSPIVVLNGGPSAEDLRIQRDLGSLFSHSSGRDGADLAMFREVTAHAVRIERAADAPAAIDAALKVALATRRPVYVEVPKHLWTASVAKPASTPLPAQPSPTGREDALAAAIVSRLQAAKRPALLIGAQVARYGLADRAVALVEHLRLPYATTFLGKSAIPESTPGFCGVYSGPRAVPAVRRTIEDADAVLAVGCVLGRQFRTLVTQHLDALLRVDADGVRIGRDAPAPASLGATIAALTAQPWRGTAPAIPATRTFDERRVSLPPRRAPIPERGIGYDELMREVSAAVSPDFVVLTDTSLSMTPAADVVVPAASGFLCNGVWQAIGWSVGAAAGVAMASGKRPLVVCGDGGFQMTVQGLSTLARHRIRAIVVVLDNGHYGIEQWLLAPEYFQQPAGAVRPYLALNRWDYPAVARSMGFAHTATADSAAAFREALAKAREAPGPALIAASVRPHDLPAGMVSA